MIRYRPPLHHAVGDETLLGVVKAHVQDIQPVGIGKDLDPEREGSSVLLLIGRILVGIELDIHVETMWHQCSGSKWIGNPDLKPALHQALCLKVASTRRSMSEIRAGIKASEIGLYGLQRQATETDRALGHRHMVNDHAGTSGSGLDFCLGLNRHRSVDVRS